MSRLAAVVGRGLLVVGFAAGAVDAAEAPPAGSAGRLRIVSQPEVEVIWEGVQLGTTDAAGLLVIDNIPPGSYELQLTKPGYRTRASEVVIGPGEQSVDLQLRRPSTAARAPAPPLPEPEPPQPKRVDPRPATAPSSLSREAGPSASEPSPGPTALPETGDAATAGPVAGLSPEAPPEMRSMPLSGAGDPATAGAPEGERPRQDSALPPLLYALGLALLIATGAVALRRHQRARARAALQDPPAQLAFQPMPRVDAEPPDFLGDIQRREQVLEDWMEAGGDEAYRDAIDVEVEVIDLGPAEEVD